MVHSIERRSDGVWVHTGSLLVRSTLRLEPPVQPPGASASLVLPDGSITTPMLAPNAAQQLVASYAQATSFSIPQTSVWVESPVQVTVTFGGYQVRTEFNVPVVCATKGQRVAWGIMVDGAAPGLGAIGALDSPENNYGMMAVGIYYFIPPAGTHRLAFGLYGPAGSNIPNSLPSTLYINEQRR
jgi:hypothetical protein